MPGHACTSGVDALTDTLPDLLRNLRPVRLCPVDLHLFSVRDSPNVQEPTGTESSVIRLLPWSGPEGKKAHLVTDGTPTPLSLLADTIESQQIETAAAIVVLARPMVGEDATLTADELRWICSRLIESLTEVLNIAESRGQRIPAHED